MEQDSLNNNKLDAGANQQPADSAGLSNWVANEFTRVSYQDTPVQVIPPIVQPPYAFAPPPQNQFYITFPGTGPFVPSYPGIGAPVQPYSFLQNSGFQASIQTPYFSLGYQQTPPYAGIPAPYFTPGYQPPYAGIMGPQAQYYNPGYAQPYGGQYYNNYQSPNIQQLLACTVMLSNWIANLQVTQPGYARSGIQPYFPPNYYPPVINQTTPQPNWRPTNCFPTPSSPIDPRWIPMPPSVPNDGRLTAVPLPPVVPPIDRTPGPRPQIVPPIDVVPGPQTPDTPKSKPQQHPDNLPAGWSKLQSVIVSTEGKQMSDLEPQSFSKYPNRYKNPNPDGCSAYIAYLLNKGLGIKTSSADDVLSNFEGTLKKNHYKAIDWKHERPRAGDIVIAYRDIQNGDGHAALVLDQNDKDGNPLIVNNYSRAYLPGHNKEAAYRGVVEYGSIKKFFNPDEKYDLKHGGLRIYRRDDSASA